LLALVTVRRGSCVAEFFFVATFRYPRFEFSRGPAGQLRWANLFASCPAARLPSTFDSGGALGIFALRSFHPVLGSRWPGDLRRAVSRFATSVSTWRTHLPFALMPSSIYFCRGIGRSNFVTHIHHKKRTIAGIQVRLLGFSPGQAAPTTTSLWPWADPALSIFPFQVFRRHETRPHRLDPMRAIGSRPASGAIPLMGFSSMFASPSGLV